jgi:hypothetical protein
MSVQEINDFILVWTRELMLDYFEWLQTINGSLVQRTEY